MTPASLHRSVLLAQLFQLGLPSSKEEILRITHPKFYTALSKALQRNQSTLLRAATEEQRLSILCAYLRIHGMLRVSVKRPPSLAKILSPIQEESAGDWTLKKVAVVAATLLGVAWGFWHMRSR